MRILFLLGPASSPIARQPDWYLELPDISDPAPTGSLASPLAARAGRGGEWAGRQGARRLLPAGNAPPLTEETRPHVGREVLNPSKAAAD